MAKKMNFGHGTSYSRAGLAAPFSEVLVVTGALFPANSRYCLLNIQNW